MEWARILRSSNGGGLVSSSGAVKGLLGVITVLLVIVLAVSAYAALISSGAQSTGSQLAAVQSQQSALALQLQQALSAQAALQKQVGTLLFQVGTIFNKTAGVAAFGGVAKPPPGQIAVKWIIGKYERLTGLNFSVYTAAPSATFWATISLKPGQSCSSDVVQQLLYSKNVTYCQSQLVGQKLPDNTLFVSPGQAAVVVFVVSSSASVKQQFAAVPHVYVPDQYQGLDLTTGVGEQCWCVAVNYPIAAGGTYIRVISITIDPSVPAGAQVILNHVLYGPVAQPSQP
jgi:hypothetical protein